MQGSACFGLSVDVDAGLDQESGNTGSQGLTTKRGETEAEFINIILHIYKYKI